MNNTRAIKFLEDVSVLENYEDGEGLETVSITEAIHATKLAQIEILEWILNIEPNKIKELAMAEFMELTKNKISKPL